MPFDNPYFAETFDVGNPLAGHMHFDANGTVWYGPDGVTPQLTYVTATGNITLTGTITLSPGATIPGSAIAGAVANATNAVAATTVPGAGVTGTVANAANAAAAASVPATGVTAGALAAAVTLAAASITGQIGTTQISNLAITTPLLAANAVTAAKIAANTITAGQLAANTITAAQIAANTITAAQIAAGTITATQMAANSVTATQIAAGAIDGKTITGALIRTSASTPNIVLNGAADQIVLTATNGTTMTLDPNATLNTFTGAALEFKPSTGANPTIKIPGYLNLVYDSTAETAIMQLVGATYDNTGSAFASVTVTSGTPSLTSGDAQVVLQANGTELIINSSGIFDSFSNQISDVDHAYTPTLTGVTGGAASGHWRWIASGVIWLQVAITAGTITTAGVGVSVSLPPGMTSFATEQPLMARFNNNVPTYAQVVSSTTVVSFSPTNVAGANYAAGQSISNFRAAGMVAIA